MYLSPKDTGGRRGWVGSAELALRRTEIKRKTKEKMCIRDRFYRYCNPLLSLAVNKIFLFVKRGHKLIKTRLRPRAVSYTHLDVYKRQV